MRRPLCLLALALLLSPLGACQCREPRASAVPAPVSLPDVFGPIDWSMDAARLRARFPEARVTQEPGLEPSRALDENGRELETREVVATDAHLEPFGTVDIRVLRFEGQPPAVLILQRSDNPFDDCGAQDTAPEALAACVSRKDRERRAIYDGLAERLTARFGPGRLEHLRSEAEPSDEEPVDLEQSERIWELPGLTLQLALGLDPRFHTPKMVRLIASRDPRYPSF